MFKPPRVIFCLLYSPKKKIVKFHAQKQIGKSHVIDIFTNEDMENISLCIFQYLTLYYIINISVSHSLLYIINFELIIYYMPLNKSLSLTVIKKLMLLLYIY
jgi:hypothetical protein